MSTFTFNWNTYSGNNISIVNNKIYIDGKEVGSPENNELRIFITGDLADVSIDSCKDITIKGGINGDAKSTSGNITCFGNIHGSAKSTSGNITTINK